MAIFLYFNYFWGIWGKNFNDIEKFFQKIQSDFYI